MNKSILAFIIGSSISFSALAANRYTVDPSHTFPSFEISHLGFSTQRGRFDETSGKITLDTKAKTGNINITIKTASISTGLAELEKHLRSEDFLDAERFPEITFASNQLTFNNEKLIGVDGDLTIHGVTKPVHLNLTHFYCGISMITMKSVCGANATTTIKRSDFSVSKYVPAIGNDVNISIQIEAIKD
jgi:polyisoprenoid-binding protein YceI